MAREENGATSGELAAMKVRAVPSMSEALRIGLNAWAAKLLVESMPRALQFLAAAGIDANEGLSMVCAAKNGERFRVIVSRTDELATPERPG